ncbi:MAG: DUF929 family protein [Candidatus Rehaiarchaeum fermentans]|nr:DUF929 domain-containing protein [Candidatus Rehaiarchaeum fermentans]MCW1302179.1 DUF929 domain-containing protein [Candidatus Rehaiarchaeum fermentans]
MKDRFALLVGVILIISLLINLSYVKPSFVSNHLTYTTSSYPPNSSAYYFQGKTGELANSTIMNDLTNTYQQFVEVGQYISNFSVVPVKSNGLTLYILNISPFYVLVPYKVQSNINTLTQNGKSTFVFIGAEGCPFCALQRVAIILALSRFGNFSKLFLDRSTTIDGNIPTYTFNFSQELFNQYVVDKPAISNAPYGDQNPEPFFTGAYYSSPYVQLVPIDEIGGSFLINVSGIAQASPLIYNNVLVPSGVLSNSPAPFGIKGFQFGGVPFFDINNQFVFDGAIVDLAPIESQVINGSRMELLQSIQNPSIGSYGFLELAAANVLAADICYTINNVAPICKLPYMQRLENKVTNLVTPFSLSLPGYTIYIIVGAGVAAVIILAFFFFYRTYRNTKNELEELRRSIKEMKGNSEEHKNNNEYNNSQP